MKYSENVTKASRFIEGFLSTAGDDSKAEDINHRPAIAAALAAHHKAVFHSSNDTIEKAKRTSQTLVDAAQSNDDRFK